MRILSFSTLFPNKVNPLHGLFVYERLRAMAEFAEVDVVAPVPFFPKLPGTAGTSLDRYTRYAEVPAKEDAGGLAIIHPRYLTFPKVFKGYDGEFMYRSLRKAVHKFVADTRYDILDAHWVYPDGFAAMRLAQELGVPYAISMRGDDISVFSGLSNRREKIRQVLNDAAVRISVCQALSDKAAPLVSSGKNCQVIGNGVDTTKFTRRDPIASRQRLGLSLDRKLVLSVGHLCARKGFDILIDALRLLYKRGCIDIQLLVVGGPGEEGNVLEQLEAAAATLPRTAVHFYGAKSPSELADWYSAADVFCLASSREGWPNVVMEALACGVPVVATRVWGTPEILNSSDLGILVNRDAGEFANAIHAALNKVWHPQRIMAHVHDRDWRTVGKEVVDLFAETLAQGRTRTALNRAS